MDAIEITGLRYYGYTGYFAEERFLGQWFEVDLTLWVDLLAAGKSDRLEDTLDYRQVVDRVRETIESSKVNTIEYLAAQIARSLLQCDDRLGKIRVRLTKVSPPIPDFPGNIAVEIIREKEDSF
ncbi:dihydroneopterin aldolase [Phormidium sp. CCY1219]|uniref:dihydroneopterin aldolase n=1 Tax=Phormidium sp. CCY1219 TaxID=2886104 RepID=UPI002D1E56C4|nr:dihydroneopterin aldolase [Phormidium sp. CCY1219]MEB3828268.1 dihydroneopterin aldolase [Phormidium sp. CCY1219]